ncbi:unnamed protein product, partial [Polarella glacialis]
ATRERIRELFGVFGDRKIIVASDKLEEKKGIPHKIMAFHKFLQKNPEWAKECVFLQLVEAAEESEDGLAETTEANKRLLEQVYQMVGEVNSAFGSIGHMPLHFLYKDVSRCDLTALMVKAHVFMDTPLRDTLSRSAHEFVWCQEETETGVLILSEFSGSAQSLRAAAVCVNPWDTNGFADAIQEALEMDEPDRLELHRYGQRHVFDHSLRRWASSFLDELLTAESECEDERLQIPPPMDHDSAVNAMRKASQRILMFGFSGTLLQRQDKIHVKIRPKISPTLRANLQVLASDTHTHVIILSGLERKILQQAIGKIPCWIIAEGGMCYREPDGTWVSNMEQLDK